MHGEGGNPGIVNGVDQKLDPTPRPSGPIDQDTAALRVPMWTTPGGGYSYSSCSPHVASIVLRHLVGMEMQQYIQEKLAGPMGFGPWGYATASQRQHAAAYAWRRQHRPARHGCGALSLLAAAQRQVGFSAISARGVRGPVRQAVCLQPALADGPDVRSRMRMATSSARQAMPTSNRAPAVGDLYRAFARSGDL